VFLSHGRQDLSQNIAAIAVDHLANLLDVTDVADVADLEVLAGAAVLVHQVQKAVLFTNHSVFYTFDVGHLHVVGGWADVLVFLGGEDIDTNQVNLGVTVLAGLGCGHLYNLAGTSLDDDEAVLPQSGALLGISLGSTGIGVLELFMIICHFCV